MKSTAVWRVSPFLFVFNSTTKKLKSVISAYATVFRIYYVSLPIYNTVLSFVLKLCVCLCIAKWHHVSVCCVQAYRFLNKLVIWIAYLTYILYDISNTRQDSSVSIDHIKTRTIIYRHWTNFPIAFDLRFHLRVVTMELYVVLCIAFNSLHWLPRACQAAGALVIVGSVSPAICCMNAIDIQEWRRPGNMRHVYVPQPVFIN